MDAEQPTQANLQRNNQRPGWSGGPLPENADNFEIPPFLRTPEDGTRLATENMVARIDNKIAKLVVLGLHPHPTMIGYRKELVEQLDNNGPYQLRWSSGSF